MKVGIYLDTLLLGLFFYQPLANSLKCPTYIQTTQSLEVTIKGWDNFIDTQNTVHTLNRITFYSDHPKQHASLAPDNEKIGGYQLSWTFNRKSLNKYFNNIWLACGYSNTSVQLIQKIPSAIKTCTVIFDSQTTQLPTVVALNCS